MVKTNTDRADRHLHGFLDPAGAHTNRDPHGRQHFLSVMDEVKNKLVALGPQRQGRFIPVSVLAKELGVQGDLLLSSLTKLSVAEQGVVFCMKTARVPTHAAYSPSGQRPEEPFGLLVEGKQVAALGTRRRSVARSRDEEESTSTSAAQATKRQRKSEPAPTRRASVGAATALGSPSPPPTTPETKLRAQNRDLAAALAALQLAAVAHEGALVRARAEGEKNAAQRVATLEATVHEHAASNLQGAELRDQLRGLLEQRRAETIATRDSAAIAAAVSHARTTPRRLWRKLRACFSVVLRRLRCFITSFETGENLRDREFASASAAAAQSAAEQTSAPPPSPPSPLFCEL